MANTRKVLGLKGNRHKILTEPVFIQQYEHITTQNHMKYGDDVRKIQLSKLRFQLEPTVRVISKTLDYLVWVQRWWRLSPLRHRYTLITSNSNSKR